MDREEIFEVVGKVLDSLTDITVHLGRIADALESLDNNGIETSVAER